MSAGTGDRTQMGVASRGILRAYPKGEQTPKQGRGVHGESTEFGIESTGNDTIDRTVGRSRTGIASWGREAVTRAPEAPRPTVDIGRCYSTPFSTGPAFGVHSRESDGGAA